MKVFLVGAGGVGEAIVTLINKYDSKGEWLKRLVVGDFDEDRAVEVAKQTNDSDRFIPVQIDAAQTNDIIKIAKKYDVDLILNACDPRFNMPIFNAAFEANRHYIDMAMSLSEAHATEPYSKIHVKLGDQQYSRHADWQKKGNLAIVGSGVEPGMVNVFARYAQDHLFDEIHELHVRDGGNLSIEGREYVFGFSIWTTIEECLNPPIVWEKDKGWYTTEPFSEPEIFELPEGIGPVEMVNVEHEEVIMFPRYFSDKGLKKSTFKFGLGRDFIQAMKVLQAFGLHKTDPISVGKAKVSPRDVVAAAAPDPAQIGNMMTGKTAAGVWIKGIKNGKQRSVYIYQVADNIECMKRLGSQAVVAQTAFNPVIMMELLAKKLWTGNGVIGPEYFPAEPFMERMEKYGFKPGMIEKDSEFRSSQDEMALKVGFK
ncbi:saccharopine dehydrogenase NADP-binding domain-containing protein [bacterium]|nr:saccharopine dehydrogenase NADP-binding domain-containing protein [bacterium]